MTGLTSIRTNGDVISDVDKKRYLFRIKQDKLVEVEGHYNYNFEYAE